MANYKNEIIFTADYSNIVMLFIIYIIYYFDKIGILKWMQGYENSLQAILKDLFRLMFWKESRNVYLNVNKVINRFLRRQLFRQVKSSGPMQGSINQPLHKLFFVMGCLLLS